MSPAALVKAQSLHRFASQQGAPLTTFLLTLTAPEGIELLDWFQGQYPDNALLAEDVAKAKVAQDPFPVLEYFTLLGFHIVPLKVLH